MSTNSQTGNPITAKLLIDAAAAIAESPVWDYARGELVWVDIPRGTINRWRPEGGTLAAIELGGEVGCVVLRSKGGYLAAVRDRVLAIDSLDRPSLLMLVPGIGSTSRLNDGKCDPAGRFWVGSMAYDERSPLGALFAIGPSGTITTVLSGVTVSNGLDWSIDGTALYYVDSATRRVDALDFDMATGQVANRRPLIQACDLDAEPDGLTVDAEDHIWVAYWGGWRVRRYTPAGILNQEVFVPASQVTSCTFGGPDLSDLFITTASLGLDEAHRAEQPLAGGLFVARPGPRGRPAASFPG